MFDLREPACCPLDHVVFIVDGRTDEALVAETHGGFRSGLSGSARSTGATCEVSCVRWPTRHRANSCDGCVGQTSASESPPPDAPDRLLAS